MDQDLNLEESNKEENWTCKTCTLINESDTNECIACGTSKDGGTENSTAVWTCNYCTTFNNVSTDICVSCGLPMNINQELDQDANPFSDLIIDYFRSLIRSRMTSSVPNNLTNEEKAEWIAFNGSSCRCTTCKLRAIRSIFNLNQTARTDHQKELAGIMMNQILPSLISSSFNSSDQILQLLAAGNNDALEEVMNRSLAEYEGEMIPANQEELNQLEDIKITDDCLKENNNQTSCVICMEEFDLKDKESCITRMPCGHIFHKKCLNTWLKESDASCPICKHRINKRLDLIKKDEDQEELSLTDQEEESDFQEEIENP